MRRHESADGWHADHEKANLSREKLVNSLRS